MSNAEGVHPCHKGPEGVWWECVGQDLGPPVPHASFIPL